MEPVERVTMGTLWTELRLFVMSVHLPVPLVIMLSGSLGISE